MQGFALRLISTFAILVLGYAWKAIGSVKNIGARSLVMMPTLLVQTAVELPTGDKRHSLLKDTSKAIAETLNKPESYVMVSLKKSDAMMFGSDEATPCAFCFLSSIGSINASTNKVMSRKICEILGKYLSVPADRVYIQFYNSEVANMALFLIMWPV